MFKVKNQNSKLKISGHVGNSTEVFSCVVVSHEVEYFSKN
jgi:hypothetical protein